MKKEGGGAHSVRKASQRDHRLRSAGYSQAPGGAPGHASELQHACPGRRPEGAAALDRSTRDAVEDEGSFGQGVGRVVGRRLPEDPAPPQEAQHASADGGGEPGDLEVGWCLGRVEPQRAVGSFGEHAIEHQRVAVHVS